MKRPTIIRLYVVGIVVAIVACLVRFPEPLKLGPPAPWHFKFSEVRVFQLNWEDAHSMDSIMQESGLNDTRFPVNGILLSDDQVESLRCAILKDDSMGGVTGACRYPHHAFVFYSESGEIVGYYDLCFLCPNGGGYPGDFSTFPDYDALRDLVSSLGMPIANPDWGLRNNSFRK